MSKKKERIRCLKCIKEKVADNYYITDNILFSSGRFEVCKDCINEIISERDMNGVKLILRAMDKPLDKERYEKSKHFGDYMRQINSLHQYQGSSWDNSVFEINTNTESNNRVDYIDKEDSQSISQALIDFWGSGFSDEEYKKLSIFYEDMKNSYEIETASHKDYLKKICVISLKMEEALADDQVDHFKKLSDAYDKLMRSAKFTAVQRSAADRTGGMNTFSEFFEYIEKEGFISKYHTDEPKDIVDETIQNLMKYTKNLILGDPNIGGLVETALQKMDDKEEINDNIDEYLDVDIEDEEVDFYDD